MILITSYYLSNNIERQNEINQCLINNVNNKFIKTIILLNDKIYDINFITRNKKKIKQIIINTKENQTKNRLYFNNAIEYINNNFYGDIIILSNSDIYFDNTLSHVPEDDMENKIYCLLRYDQKEDGTKDIFRHYDEPRSDSQDSWIFKAPLNIDLQQVNFSFGTLGCDNIFANVLFNHDFMLSNPSYDIITTHLHNCPERNYNEDERIHGNYCLIKPGHITSEPSVRFMNY
jgi:hypothetical protein